jgi:hypothetical protein
MADFRRKIEMALQDMQKKSKLKKLKMPGAEYPADEMDMGAFEEEEEEASPEEIGETPEEEQAEGHPGAGEETAAEETAELHALSDEELLAELKRRGISAKMGSPEEEEQY